MCMGCATNADFLLTSGILGAASLRVAARRLRPVGPSRQERPEDAPHDDAPHEDAPHDALAAP
jgi:hypothetical protein